jgi:hypothetical protein
LPPPFSAFLADYDGRFIAARRRRPRSAEALAAFSQPHCLAAIAGWMITIYTGFITLSFIDSCPTIHLAESSRHCFEITRLIKNSRFLRRPLPLIY